jgi:hypothetical protein
VPIKVPTEAPANVGDTKAPTQKPTQAPTAGTALLTGKSDSVELKVVVQGKKCGSTDIEKAEQAAAFQTAMAKSLGTKEDAVEVMVMCKNEPIPRVMPDETYEQTLAKTDKLLKEARVLSLAEVGELIESSTVAEPEKPESAVDAVKKGAEAINLVRVTLVVVNADIPIQISVPMSRVGPVMDSIQTGIGDSLGLGKKQITIGAGRQEDTKVRRLGDGCETTLVDVSLETGTEDPNSQEVKQLTADFTKVVTSGQLILNVKAAAATQNVLTNCLKDQNEKLETPEIKQKTVQKEVVVSDRDGGLVLAFSIRATSNEGAKRIATATENEVPFTKVLAENLRKQGETINTEALSVEERTVIIQAGAPTKVPTNATNDSTSVPSVAPAPTKRDSSSDQTGREAALFAAFVVLFTVMLVVGGTLMYGKNLANWPCCGAAAAWVCTNKKSQKQQAPTNIISAPQAPVSAGTIEDQLNAIRQA